VPNSDWRAFCHICILGDMLIKICGNAKYEKTRVFQTKGSKKYLQNYFI